MALSKQVYLITKQFPPEEKFGITSQSQRAAVSIASNIAEGAGLGTNKEFTHFLNIALGSAFELETQILLSNELNYIDENVMKSIMTNLHAIQPKLNSLIKKYGDLEIEK